VTGLSPVVPLALDVGTVLVLEHSVVML